MKRLNLNLIFDLINRQEYEKLFYVLNVCKLLFELQIYFTLEEKKAFYQSWIQSMKIDIKNEKPTPEENESKTFTEASIRSRNINIKHKRPHGKYDSMYFTRTDRENNEKPPVKCSFPGRLLRLEKHVEDKPNSNNKEKIVKEKDMTT